jgi:aminoglycoside phosphotransferase family enzyme/predicted kinase
MTQLVDELAALLPAPVQRRETHGAWVLLSGEHAYKLRKPVRLPYLDYSDVARRLDCARAEVALNQTLAPGIYLRVQALVRDGDALALGPDGASEDAVDYVVVMRRFDEAATMAAHAVAGTLHAEDVDATARAIAAFHRQAAPAAGGRGRVTARVLADLADLAALDAADLDAAGLRAFADAALHRHGDEIDDRARDGLWRDGHGDLRAEHVVLADPIAIVDRVEFDPELRRTDVASDVAFLTMDLEALGAPWAARRLLGAYADAGGRPPSAALHALLAWQRAIVRLKIALLRGDATNAARLRTLAETLAWRERICPVLLVCGPPASGKSTLAGALAEMTGLRVVSTDHVRKDLHGVPATTALAADAYDEAVTRHVYTEVGRRAAAAVDEDGGVIVDANAGRPEDRAALGAGLAGRGPIRAVVCEADIATLRRRAAARLADPQRTSDAGPQIAAALAERFTRPQAGHEGVVQVAGIDTTDGATVAAAAAALDARVEGEENPAGGLGTTLLG